MQLLASIGIGVGMWLALFWLARILPMESHTRSRLQRFLAVVLIVLMAGPETGVFMAASAALDALGAELFITSLMIGFRMLPVRLVLVWSKSLAEKFDPYFFLPSPGQIRECPPIAAHALPCLVPICLAFVFWGDLNRSWT